MYVAIGRIEVGGTEARPPCRFKRFIFFILFLKLIIGPYVYEHLVFDRYVEI
jgi:hypothetical protein